ncbi:MAG: hypothetical protein ACHREM_14435 [Polyangiales bacterium]
MSNGGQQPQTSGSARATAGNGWKIAAAVGAALGVVASQYFPFVGGEAPPWSLDRLQVLPLHVVVFGGLLAIVARAIDVSRPSVESEAVRASLEPPRVAAPVAVAAPPPPPPPAAAPPADEGGRNEAITAPPPKMSGDSDDGVPTAQRLEAAQQAAASEEEDRTLVGDLSELAKAQELAELQRQHREKKKAEQAAKKGGS